MRITTPSRFTGSGPKKEANTPGAPATGPAAVSLDTWASLVRAAIKPP